MSEPTVPHTNGVPAPPEPGDACVICGETLSEPTEIRPCGHAHFHAACIVGWLYTSMSCPMCRGLVCHIVRGAPGTPGYAVAQFPVSIIGPPREEPVGGLLDGPNEGGGTVRALWAGREQQQPLFIGGLPDPNAANRYHALLQPAQPPPLPQSWTAQESRRLLTRRRRHFITVRRVYERQAHEHTLREVRRVLDAFREEIGRSPPPELQQQQSQEAPQSQGAGSRSDEQPSGEGDAEEEQQADRG